MGTDGELVLRQVNAERFERQALVELLYVVVVDLRRLELAVLHEHVVGDDGHDERERDGEPDQEEDVDDDGEEAGGDAAAEARPEAGVDLGARGARRQAAHDEQDHGQRAHHRRHDDHDRLHDTHRVPLELDLERAVQHLDRDRQRAVQAPAEHAHAAQRDHRGDNRRERASSKRSPSNYVYCIRIPMI